MNRGFFERPQEPTEPPDIEDMTPDDAQEEFERFTGYKEVEPEIHD